MPANDIWFMIALFIFGGILMILELVMPGFGVAGIAGIPSLIAGVIVGSSVLTSGQLAVVIFWFCIYRNNGGVVSTDQPPKREEYQGCYSLRPVLSGMKAIPALKTMEIC